MKAANQAQARAAAAKFIEANAGPGRFFAVIDYAGTMRVTQNFTDDTERLKQIVSTPKLSTDANTNASLGSPVFANYDSYSNRNVLLALRSVARSMAALPGRKSLIWLTSGFPLTPDNQPDLTSLISACNRANVAVYPVDVRGLSGAMRGISSRLQAPIVSQGDARLVYASESLDLTKADGTPRLVYVGQSKGGGTGGKTGGGTTGGSRPAPPTITVPSPFSTRPRISILPPPSGSAQQEVLYVLATGTGGFVIANSNDLQGGLDKIGKEINEYYIVGYVPPSPDDGTCHTLKVEVAHSGAVVRSRSGYCAVKPVDFLAGKPIGKEMESHAMAAQPGDVAGSVSAPFFYTSPGTARVNLAIDVSGAALQFQKGKGGKYQAVLNVMGIATKPDGTVAARFSDAVDLDMDKKQVQDLASRPYHYENQFYIASGQYTLNIAVNTGDKFGKFEVPLNVDPYDKAQFSMSALAFSREFHKATEMAQGPDSDLMQDRTPLVTQGLQLVPSASNRFKKTERAAVYLEVYEPLLAESKPAKVGLELRILDQGTGKQELAAAVPDTQASVIPGNPVIPMGVPLPLSSLQPGTYIVELKATDSAGNASVARKAVFTVE